MNNLIEITSTQTLAISVAVSLLCLFLSQSGLFDFLKPIYRHLTQSLICLIISALGIMLFAYSYDLASKANVFSLFCAWVQILIAAGGSFGFLNHKKAKQLGARVALPDDEPV